MTSQRMRQGPYKRPGIRTRNRTIGTRRNPRSETGAKSKNKARVRVKVGIKIKVRTNTEHKNVP